MAGLENAQDTFPGADSHYQIGIMESGYLSATDTEESSTDTQRLETPVANAGNGISRLQDIFGNTHIEPDETIQASATPESGYSSNHADAGNVTSPSMSPTLGENDITTTAVTIPVQHPPQNVMPLHDLSGEQKSQSQGNLLALASISSESLEASDQRQQNILEGPPPFDVVIPDIPDLTENSLFGQEQAVEETSGTLFQESENSDDFDVHFHERPVFLKTAYDYFHSTNMVYDIDLAMIHRLRRKGEIPFPKFCLSCFLSPVGVQNIPCGCICNCGQCAPLMQCCAGCQSIIRRYITLN